MSMKKRLDNMIEAYGKKAQGYDYLARVLTSFAEIYNYDYTESSLMEDGSFYNEKGNVVRKDGIIGRIRAYYENSNDFVKWFYHEPIFSILGEKEFGFVVFGSEDLLYGAELISLGVRILEALGLRDLVVSLSVSKENQEKLCHDLDYLDISYELRDDLSSMEDVYFEIHQKVNEVDVCFLKGGSLAKQSESISGISKGGFYLCGFTDTLYTYCMDHLFLDQKLLDVLITYQTEKERDHALYLTQELRLNGFKSEMIFRTTKEEIRKNYPTHYVISVKEEDILNSEVLLVDFDTNEREKVNEMDLISHLDLHI